MKRLGVAWFSTGEMLREAVANGTPLGAKAQEYINQGRLVPDSVVLDLVDERLSQSEDRNGFLLDGFPRTIPQATGLDALLEARGLALDRVLLFRVPREIIIERVAGRRTCRDCGVIINVFLDFKGKTEACPQCGGELYQREDDREATIAARLEVYETQTKPLVAFYHDRHLLSEIDGVGSIEEVNERVLVALEAFGAGSA